MGLNPLKTGPSSRPKMNAKQDRLSVSLNPLKTGPSSRPRMLEVETSHEYGLNPLKTGPSSRRKHFFDCTENENCLNPLKTGPSSRLLRFFSAFCQDQKRRFRAHPRDYGLRDAKWVPWGPEPTHQSSSGQPSGISAHLLRPRRLISTTYPFSWEPLQGARKILFLRMEQPHGGRRVIRLSQISSLPALLQSRRIRNPGGSPDTGGSTLRCRS